LWLQAKHPLPDKVPGIYGTVSVGWFLTGLGRRYKRLTLSRRAILDGGL